MANAPKKMHHRVTWEPMADPDEVIRSSIGGYPILPGGKAYPRCTEDGCNQPMALFMQFEIEERFHLPFEAGSALSIFQCIEHDDPFETLDSLAPKKGHDLLPNGYWDHTNYAIYFAKAGGQQQWAERDPSLGYARLLFAEEQEPGSRSLEALTYKNIKVGGTPFWVQKSKIWKCSCGSEMDFICSLPENLLFPKTPESPREPNGRQDSHFLFLGLFAYLFACRARCNPRAVVAVRQNG
jgi:hypothetical protein